MPVFAQESLDVSNQLENQINQDNLKELEQRISNIENKNLELEKGIQESHSDIGLKLSKINDSLIESGDIANKSLWLGLYVSIIFASIAIFATIWNGVVLRGQTKKIERDVNARIRPILGRKYIDSSGIYAINPEKMLIHLTNTGTLPALYLKTKNYIEIKNEPPEKFTPKFSFDKKDNVQKYHAMGPK